MKDARWTVAHGRQMVSKWRKSELSMAAFARMQGVSLHKLRYWRDQDHGGSHDAVLHGNRPD